MGLFGKSRDEKALDKLLYKRCNLFFAGTKAEYEDAFNERIRIILLKSDDGILLREQALYYEPQTGKFLHGEKGEVPPVFKQYLLDEGISGFLIKQVGENTPCGRLPHYGLVFALEEE